MALRKKAMTKKEINQLTQIKDSQFYAELDVLLEEFRQGDEVKGYLAEHIKNDIPLYKAVSVTWLVYEICNAYNDHELGRDFLSELVADVEDLVEEIEELVQKYK